jgi:hypothetical protein
MAAITCPNLSGGAPPWQSFRKLFTAFTGTGSSAPTHQWLQNSAPPEARPYSLSRTPNPG